MASVTELATSSNLSEILFHYIAATQEKTTMASSVKMDQNTLSASVPFAAGLPPAATPAAFDFLDLKAQFATIREEVMEAVTRVMESQVFILGNEVRSFEKEFVDKFAAKHAISCASGSDALVLALMAAGVAAGDEVITTPFTFVATAGSIARVGAIPVFVDIDPVTFNIDQGTIAAAITPRTRAIMPVHLFGLSADLAPIVSTAQRNGLKVIEDSAQAIGARYQDGYVGNSGHFGCFSFFPSKNLGGAGDGGLVTTPDAEAAERLRLLRAHGSKKKYHHDILGTNSRLDALQAAILRVKLRHLEQWTESRRAHAQRYRELFEENGLTPFVTAPSEPASDYHHVYNQFSIRARNRDGLREFLCARGLPTEVYYPIPLHLQPAFSYLGYREADFPQAEAASREVLALPVFPELTELQITSVVKAMRDFYLH
jgi:dTDP-4-amino-4,6-dideoxygalactose transaminase